MSLSNFRTASRSLTQKSKKSAKIKIDFSDFSWGRRCWLAVSLFFPFLFNTAVPPFFLFFFENIFYRVKSGLFDDLVESTLLAGGKSQKY
jgi:hypothetical protein